MAYHDWLAQRDFKTPTIAMAQHSGLHEEYSRSDGKAASFQAMWAPTIECLARGGFPTILTGFTGLEMDQDAACLLEWGAEIVVEPTENPFCGSLPRPDPARDNAFFVANSHLLVLSGAPGMPRHN